MASVILWTISSARPTEVSGATSGDNDDTICLLPVRLTSAIYLIFDKFCRYSCHINNRTVVFRTTRSPHPRKRAVPMSAPASTDDGYYPLHDEDDASHLHALGYKSEFKREMSPWANFSLGFTYLSPVVGVYTLFAYALATGGPPMALR